MNTEPRKLTRLSLSGAEYQFEYIPARANEPTEFRLRRGGFGTNTRWVKTPNLGRTLQKFGFTSTAPTLLNDFYFESFLGRGETPVSKEFVRHLSNAAGLNYCATHLFSRLKRVSEDTWILPSSAVVSSEMFQYAAKLIRKYP